MNIDLDSPCRCDGEEKDTAELAVVRITAVQRPLYAYIRSLVIARDDVEDILQEVNLVLWRKIGEFDGRGPFLTWACHIAYLQVLAYCKRRRRDRRVVLDEAAMNEIARSMAAKVERIDARMEALGACLSKLAPSHRQMILRRYGRGSSVRALAEELDRPADSVRVTLHRIRQTLIDCVGRAMAGGGIT